MLLLQIIWSLKNGSYILTNDIPESKRCFYMLFKNYHISIKQSRCWSIRANFSLLGLTGRREQCSPGREEREWVEPDAGQGGEGRAQLPGKCSSPELRPPSYPGSEGSEWLQLPVQKRLPLRGGGGDRPSSISGLGVFALLVVSAGFSARFWVVAGEVALN